MGRAGPAGQTGRVREEVGMPRGWRGMRKRMRRHSQTRWVVEGLALEARDEVRDAMASISASPTQAPWRACWALHELV